MKNYWRRTNFWVKVADTCALLGGLATGGMEGVQAITALVLPKGLIFASVAFMLAGTLVRMWMDDTNGDGNVDMFQR